MSVNQSSEGVGGVAKLKIVQYPHPALLTVAEEIREKFTRDQRRALDLLARGGARYGTEVVAMKELKEMGLCFVFDKGEKLRVGRFTWRPTQKGRDVIAALSLTQSAHASGGGE